MDIITENIDGEDIILGKRFLMEVGDVNVDKIIYRPTLELFEKFFNIIKDKPWFNDYNFIVVGSFTNIMNNNKHWETWDVDMNVSSNSKELNYDEIKIVLNECSRVALEECDFYLEIYFNLSNEFPKLHVNEPFEGDIFDNLCYKYKVDILSHLLYVRRDNVTVTRWHLNPGEEVIEGLWKRHIEVPSKKQVDRKINNLCYDSPIDIKEYFK